MCVSGQPIFYNLLLGFHNLYNFVGKDTNYSHYSSNGSAEFTKNGPKVTKKGK
jgi:hypothetical protein